MHHRPEALDAAAPVLEVFEELRVRHHVGGSLASSVYGTPRATADVDVVAELSDDLASVLVERFSGAYYVDAGAVLDAIRRRRSFNLIHLETMVKVDVFIPEDRAFDQQELARARRLSLEPVEGARLYFVKSAEDLVVRKLEWYRRGGEVSERQWNDVIGVLRVQAGRLDEEYLDRWAGELRLSDLLDAAMKQAGGP
ncbi:MAG: hypothetical protein HYX52_01355 [Chloroflexi bacterium]|nr:hypothetical protein [Chloroflexota bacterium]